MRCTAWRSRGTPGGEISKAMPRRAGKGGTNVRPKIELTWTAGSLDKHRSKKRAHAKKAWLMFRTGAMSQNFVDAAVFAVQVACR